LQSVWDNNFLINHNINLILFFIMKKIFSFLCALAMSLPMFAGVVVFNSADFEGQGVSGTGGAVTATKAGVTFSCDKAFGASNAVRCYKNSVVTISAETTIQTLEFIFEGAAYTGELETSISVNATSWTNTMAAQARITKITVTVEGEGDINVWTPDTIGVTEARALIEAGDTHDHYVQGVVATFPSEPQNGNTIFWLTDLENETDSLEGYKISGLNNAAFADQASIPFTKGDHVLLYASSLKKYNNIYEINTGYLAEILSSEITRQEFEYTAGVVNFDSRDGVMVIEMGEDFSAEVEASSVAAFAGTYTTAMTIGDVTLPEGAKIKFTFVKVENGAHIYHVSMVYTVEETKVQYVINSDVAFTSNDDSFGTVDDGSRIVFMTVESALAKCIEVGSSETKEKFNVVGYAISIDNDGQYVSKDAGGFGNATFNIADNADETDPAKMIKVYRCYPVDNMPEADRTIVLGKRYLINGKLVNFKGNTPEITQGGTYDIYEATAIDEIKVLDNTKTFKTIYKGQVVIVKDGEFFNVLGTKL